MFREKYKNLTEDGKKLLEYRRNYYTCYKNALEIKSD